MRKQPWNVGELFDVIMEQLKKKEVYPDELLDYALKDDSTKTQIITEEWDTIFDLNFGGSEGIYLTIFMRGNISGQDRQEIIPMGTCKTLEESDEAMYRMAKLAADFILVCRQFVYANMDDFTWYGADVEKISPDGLLRGFLTCCSLEKAYKRAREYTEKNADTVFVVRDNAKRIFFTVDGIPFEPPKAVEPITKEGDGE